MAVVPMKQTVTIKRGADTLDDWGNAVPGEPIAMKCRIEEGSQLLSYSSVGLANGEIFVSTARILFDKLADIRETDIITFTNELGITFEKMPKQINVKRGVSGKPILTEVVV